MLNILSFLRKQIVKYNHYRSVEIPVTCEIHQGSVFRPMLFLFYINYLLKHTSNLPTIFFPDDTNLFYSGQDISKIESIVNEELVRVDSLGRRANVRNVNFQSLYSGQSTLSTQLISPKF